MILPVICFDLLKWRHRAFVARLGVWTTQLLCANAGSNGDAPGEVALLEQLLRLWERRRGDDRGRAHPGAGQVIPSTDDQLWPSRWFAAQIQAAALGQRPAIPGRAPA